MTCARRITVWLAAALMGVLLPVDSGAQQGVAIAPNQVNQHLQAGEFLAAQNAIGALPQQQQMGLLGQMSGLQAATGNLDAAARTVAMGGALGPDSPLGGAGGQNLADFSSLMELIQTTVVPDTWEALGGPSTMSPYAAGIVVDGNGLIRDPEQTAKADRTLDALRLASTSVAGRSGAADWRSPAELRKVSLSRLQHVLRRRGLSSLPPTDAMRFLAGLSRIQYVFLQKEGDHADVILAGPVTGTRQAADGSYVDHETGNAILQLDALGYALDAAEAGRPFGCTIEPTIDGVRNVAKVQAEIRSGNLPGAAASKQLKEALGLQEIRVFGTAANTSVAMLMVEADRHMKQLALGTHPMPRGIPNYLDIVQATVNDGPMTGSFLRLWFAAQPISVRSSADRLAFELSGRPLKLMSEQEVADRQGRRTAAAQDIRAVKFAETFNEHFDDIARDYPLYDRLRGIYDLAAVSQLMKLYLPDQQRHEIAGVIARPSDWVGETQTVPTHTESLVVHRSFRSKRKIHSITVASGGVQVNPTIMLTAAKPPVYESLASMNGGTNRPPVRDDRWWWD